MDLEEEIAQTLDRAFDAWDGQESEPRFVARQIMPLVKRAQAEALREAAGRFVLTTETDLWDEGFNEGLNVVLAQADRIENEGAGA